MKTILKCHLILCACGCGQLRLDKDDHYRKRRYIVGHDIRLSNNPVWNNGKIKNKAGYILILNRNHRRANCMGYVFEHVLVFEDTHNCCVLKWANIHHRDHNPSNNVWYNLKGMTKWQHGSLHHKGKKNSEDCKRKIRLTKTGSKHSKQSKMKTSLSIKEWWNKRKNL